MKSEKVRICNPPIYKYENADVLEWEKFMEQIEREANEHHHHQSGFAITIERYGKTVKLELADKCFGFFIAVCVAAFCVLVLCLSVYFLHRVSYSVCEPVQPKDFSSKVDHQTRFAPSVTENTNSLDLLFHSFSLFGILAYVFFFKLFTFFITFAFTP
jgi:hypothetical protein